MQADLAAVKPFLGMARELTGEAAAVFKAAGKTHANPDVAAAASGSEADKIQLALARATSAQTMLSDITAETGIIGRKFGSDLDYDMSHAVRALREGDTHGAKFSLGLVEQDFEQTMNLADGTDDLLRALAAGR